MPDQAVDQQLTGGRTVFLMDEQKRGFLSYSRVLDEIEIGDLAVLPDFQGQGIGRGLLADLLEKQADCHFFLEVKEGNGVARKLYERVGFSTYRTRKHYYQDGQTAILMEKKA
ncbi:GNAT family N-acetyltransferase [Fructobacillus papyrifericola]|uniref:GNAT family N-acetyltransferase n=1 Tax=Fructobacillus papyrifericola TaxID=2713172 RepID=A0ABS5QTD9_9LACO|nr:GNAT family N-acetyltransferase [Fructobacillus papyrifericola]